MPEFLTHCDTANVCYFRMLTLQQYCHMVIDIWDKELQVRWSICGNDKIMEA